MEALENLDVQLFFWINSRHSSFFDQFFHLISTRWFWIPFYFFLVFLVQRNFGWKGLGLVLISVGLIVLWTDTGSVHLFKNYFQRYRPCHNLDYGYLVHLYEGHCGGQFGFVSSHAANFFGLALYFSVLLSTGRYWVGIVFFACAILVSYSRIYLGVHYPADVLVGGLYGMAGALLIGSFTWKKIKAFK